MLYIIGTPIGNLEDISLRQAKTLVRTPFILSEDTRSSETLLCACEDLFSLKRVEGQKIISYYKEREFEKLPYVLELLAKGNDVALISEAGMPVISDPGGLLIDYCLKNNIAHTVIPGPSSVTTALAIAGVKSQNWSFVGFLPKKEGDLKKSIQKMKDSALIWKNHSLVAFESAGRFGATMNICSTLIPNATVIVCRELTKKFEEVLVGKPAELAQKQLKGEIVLIFQLP